MGVNVGKKDIFWGYAGQILYSGINVILLPFILKKLPESELGLWYTFTSIGALVDLLDFGFKTTVTRNVAYAWGGAKAIPQTGQNVVVSEEGPNLMLLARVMKTAKVVYAIVAAVAAFLISTAGTWYIIGLTHDVVEPENFIFAWAIYVAAVFFNICYGYWMPSLKGVGAIKESYQTLAVSKVFHLLTAIIGLLLGYRLTAVAFGFFMSSFITRIVSRYKFYKYDDIKKYSDELKRIRISLAEAKSTFKLIWTNAYKQGIMSFSNFMADKCAILVCSSAYGLAASARFGLTMQLLSVVSILGNVLFNSLMPYMIQLKMKKSYEKAYELITISAGIQALIIFAGGMAIAFLANPALRIIGSNSMVLPVPESIALTIFVYVFSSQQLFSSYIIAGNKIPMYKAYLVTGLMTVFFQMTLTLLFGEQLRLWTIILSQLLMQVLYNGWKWPLFVACEHDVRLRVLYRDVFRNSLNALFVTGGIKECSKSQ